MKCRIENDFATDSYKVWLYSTLSEHGARVLQHVEGDTWREVEVPHGGELPTPTFVMRGDWLRVFAREAMTLPLADDATVAHLKDAQEVRDRLLRIVEHKMGVVR